MTQPGPFLIGLTGSIGMGKSTTTAMFAKSGIPVWDADAAVARLYAKGGAAVPKVANLVPQAVVEGAVDRNILRSKIAQDPSILPELEKAVHPLVAADRQQFIARSSDPILLLDIPLLFETGSDAQMDLVVVVSTAPDIEAQRQRVLARPEMNPALFASILAKQMPDADKRARADVVIPTNSMEIAQSAVETVIRDVKEKLRHA